MPAFRGVNLRHPYSPELQNDVQLVKLEDAETKWQASHTAIAAGFISRIAAYSHISQSARKASPSEHRIAAQNCHGLLSSDATEAVHAEMRLQRAHGPPDRLTVLSRWLVGGLAPCTTPASTD